MFLVDVSCYVSLVKGVIFMLFQGGSGRFDLTVGPKQTMGKVVSTAGKKNKTAECLVCNSKVTCPAIINTYFYIHSVCRCWSRSFTDLFLYCTSMQYKYQV